MPSLPDVLQLTIVDAGNNRGNQKDIEVFLQIVANRASCRLAGTTSATPCARMRRA